LVLKIMISYVITILKLSLMVSFADAHYVYV